MAGRPSARRASRGSGLWDRRVYAPPTGYSLQVTACSSVLLCKRGARQTGATVLAYHCQVDRCAKPVDVNNLHAGPCVASVSR